MNYMKQVAQMLGVEIEEAFEVKNDYFYGKYRFNYDYLLVYDSDKNCWKGPCDTTLRRLIIGDLGITKISKQILDDVEKEYLTNVIKPFRDKVDCIKKVSYKEKYEFICVKYKEIFNDVGGVVFPCFDKGIMYKGMEVKKAYTLEELGI